MTRCLKALAVCEGGEAGNPLGNAVLREEAFHGGLEGWV